MISVKNQQYCKNLSEQVKIGEDDVTDLIFSKARVDHDDGSFKISQKSFPTVKCIIYVIILR